MILFYLIFVRIYVKNFDPRIFYFAWGIEMSGPALSKGSVEVTIQNKFTYERKIENRIIVLVAIFIFTSKFSDKYVI